MDENKNKNVKKIVFSIIGIGVIVGLVICFVVAYNNVEFFKNNTSNTSNSSTENTSITNTENKSKSKNNSTETTNVNKSENSEKANCF